jgi:drug/metabolite transporter (DMT)-like permease
MENIKYYISLLIIMVFWGLNVPHVKILVENLSPVTMTGFRVMAAGLTVFLILSLLKLVRLLGEQITSYHIIGLVLIVIGVLLGSGAVGTGSVSRVQQQ